MEKKINIFWTDRAKSDLRELYDFLKLEIEEEKAFSIIHTIYYRTTQLRAFQELGRLEPYLLHLKRPYKKLIEGHYKIIYRIHN